jgi:hypothetical protein
MLKKIKNWWNIREYEERRWLYERKTGYPKSWFNGDETFGERVIFYFTVTAAELLILSPFIVFLVAPFVTTCPCV